MLESEVGKRGQGGGEEAEDRDVSTVADQEVSGLSSCGRADSFLTVDLSALWSQSSI